MRKLYHIEGSRLDHKRPYDELGCCSSKTITATTCCTALAATTVKKPSENSPLKRANRRRCERKQTPQNRVIAMKGRSWEKTVEAARLLEKQVLREVAQGNF